MNCGHDRLLLHSIVDNKSGTVLADAHLTFDKFGFATIPRMSQGLFILEEEELSSKIKQVRSQVLNMPICETHEGSVLQLVDRENNSVLQLIRIKSAEYQFFRLMHEVLLSAIERGEIETQSDRIIQNYTREHRAILKQLDTTEHLPHPEVFYFDIFNAAFSLVSQRRSPRDF